MKMVNIGVCRIVKNLGFVLQAPENPVKTIKPVAVFMGYDLSCCFEKLSRYFHAFNMILFWSFGFCKQRRLHSAVSPGNLLW